MNPLPKNFNWISGSVTDSDAAVPTILNFEDVMVHKAPLPKVYFKAKYVSEFEDGIDVYSEPV